MKTLNMRIVLTIAFALTPMMRTAFADVHVNNMFADNCVLQRNASVPIWGTALDGEQVTVNYAGQTVSTIASNGKWIVRLAPMQIATGTLIVSCPANTVTLNNVKVGDVWFAAGQSNMEFRMSEAQQWDAIAASNDPDLCHFRIPIAESLSPLTELQSTAVWQISNPANCPGFSAVAYFFAKELRSQLNVPVGIICSAVGGTPIEYWMAESSLDGLGIDKNKLYYSLFYNSMVKPVMPYAIKGVIWYQGEANGQSGDGYQYEKLMSALIGSWRNEWNQGSFPFLFVQIAPFTYNLTNGWIVKLREAQLKASQNIGNTAMVVTTDVGNCADIHPKNKKPVGDRLALTAMNIAYSKKPPYKGSRDTFYTGPIYRSMTIINNQVVIQFDGVGSGLVAKDGPLTGWQICGSDKVFFTANAQIRDREVVVSSPQVSSPAAVRYGWAECPTVNLFNMHGLPASPFRTDDY